MTLTFRSLSSTIAAVRRRVTNRADREHEMTINRLVLSGLTFGYLLTASAFGFEDAERMIEATAHFFAIYAIGSLALFAHLLKDPSTSHGRRTLAMFLDLGLFSYGMIEGGSAMSCLWPIYLWVVLGNGFRFGVRYLTASAITAVICFGTVILVTPFWYTKLSLSLGLLGALVILPAYVSQLIRKLNEAKAQAEAANSAKTRFLASVSHELRTPLNAIIGMGELMRGTQLNAEQREMMATVRGSARTLLSMIDSILDFSRIEAGRMPMRQQEVDLDEILVETRSMLTAQAREKGLVLAVQTTAAVPAFIRTDPRHLKEILINLASNAVKFTEQGSVTVAVDLLCEGEARYLHVEVTDTGIGIAPEARERIFDSFTQADDTIIDRFGGTGLGLALVRELVSLQGGRLGVNSAPGLGSTFWFDLPVELAAAPEAAELAPGQDLLLVTADRQLLASAAGALAVLRGNATSVSSIETAALMLPPGETSRAVLLVDEALPGLQLAALARLRQQTGVSCIRIASEDVARLGDQADRAVFGAVVSRHVKPRELARAIAAVSRRLRGDSDDPLADALAEDRLRDLAILVADDNLTNQKVLGKVLERAGHRAQFANDGEAALDLMERHRFDIVLLDLNMPKLSGTEVAQLFRFQSLGQDYTPLLALTADATPEARQRCADAGIDGCLSKPVDPAELLRTIDALVRKTRTGEVAALPAPAPANPEPVPATGPAVPLDEAKIADLTALGGIDFVRELTTTFRSDARTIVADIAAAQQRGDVTEIREQLHALRSAAANVGAQELYELCLRLRDIDAAQLARDGRQEMDALHAALAAVEAELDARFPRGAARAA